MARVWGTISKKTNFQNQQTHLELEIFVSKNSCGLSLGYNFEKNRFPELTYPPWARYFLFKKQLWLEFGVQFPKNTFPKPTFTECCCNLGYIFQTRLLFSHVARLRARSGLILAWFLVVFGLSSRHLGQNSRDKTLSIAISPLTFETQHFEFQISAFELQLSKLYLRTPNFEFPVSSFERRASSFEFRASTFELRTSSFDRRPSNFELQA